MALESLKDVREKLLGYRFDTVVREASIEAERLRLIEETQEPPTIAELESLARLYGLDADVLAEIPIMLNKGDGVEVMTSLDEFREVDDAVKARIVRAANAARDLVTLYARSGDGQQRRERFKNERPPLTEWLGSKDQPHQQGAAMARELRRSWQLGSEPIASLRELVRERLPSLSVLYANLGDRGPAGLGFIDSLRGPAIVLNLQGKNRNPCVRRLSLAHELGHLLVDWNGYQPIASISGYFNEDALDRERRANSFAVRLLCPPNVIANASLTEPAHRAKLARYGLPYAAWRLYVRNEGGEELPKDPPVELVGAGTEEIWQRNEEPEGLEGFPLQAVPPERRTIIAQLAARLYSRGEMARDELAEMLGVSPLEPLEQVLDYFVLDPPTDEESSAA